MLARPSPRVHTQEPPRTAHRLLAHWVPQAPCTHPLTGRKGQGAAGACSPHTGRRRSRGHRLGWCSCYQINWEELIWADFQAICALPKVILEDRLCIQAPGPDRGVAEAGCTASVSPGAPCPHWDPGPQEGGGLSHLLPVSLLPSSADPQVEELPGPQNWAEEWRRPTCPSQLSTPGTRQPQEELVPPSPWGCILAPHSQEAGRTAPTWDSTPRSCLSFPSPTCLHCLCHHLTVPLPASRPAPTPASLGPRTLVCTGFDRLQGRYLLWERVKHSFSDLFRRAGCQIQAPSLHDHVSRAWPLPGSAPRPRQH